MAAVGNVVSDFKAENGSDALPPAPLGEDSALVAPAVHAESPQEALINEEKAPADEIEIIDLRFA